MIGNTEVSQMIILIDTYGCKAITYTKETDPTEKVVHCCKEKNTLATIQGKSYWSIWLKKKEGENPKVGLLCEFIIDHLAWQKKVCMRSFFVRWSVFWEVPNTEKGLFQSCWHQLVIYLSQESEIQQILFISHRQEMSLLFWK